MNVYYSLEPMRDERSNIAAEHHECLAYVLSIYENPIWNTFALIGDNVNTTKTLEIWLVQYLSNATPVDIM